MSARIATESLRDLRDALDFAEHDLANGEPGAAHAVRYNRRELESMAHGIACDLIDARDALSAAPAPTTVPAPLVRAYLDAVDEWERERSAPVARTVARTAMIAARTALDAALATTTTTPKESR